MQRVGKQTPNLTLDLPLEQPWGVAGEFKMPRALFAVAYTHRARDVAEVMLMTIPKWDQLHPPRSALILHADHGPVCLNLRHMARAPGEHEGVTPCRRYRSDPYNRRKPECRPDAALCEGSVFLERAGQGHCREIPDNGALTSNLVDLPTTLRFAVPK